MYGNVGGVAAGAGGALAMTGSNVSVLAVVVGVAGLVLGAVIMLRERAIRRAAMAAGSAK